MALVKTVETHRRLLLLLVNLGCDIKWSLLESLRVDITLLLIYEESDCFDALAETSGMESVVVVARVLDLGSLADEVLHDSQVAVASGKHYRGPADVALCIHQPLDVWPPRQTVFCAPFRAGLLV